MSVFQKLGEALHSALKKLTGSALVDEKAVKELTRDIQRALLQSDVNVELVLELSKRIEDRALSEKLPPGITRREHIVKVVYEELTRILGDKNAPLELHTDKPNVLVLVGIQGSGKTTSIGKLARYLTKKGHKTGIVAGDTFRLGAYEQLKQISEQIEVPIFGEPKEKNSIKVIKQGVDSFRKQGYQVILVDTAGRHKEESSLMKEMREVVEAVKPDEVILVLDGTVGQQAAVQARAFKENTKVGSILVTKLDGSAKGGGALSAVAATGVPIKFIGTGEKMDDLEKFNPQGFVGRLLGVADIEALVEKVKEAEVTPTKERVQTFLKGKITLTDFYDQIKNFGKIGTMDKLLGYMGLGPKLPKDAQEAAELRIQRWKAIMQSMTKEELNNPKIIGGTRVTRIARGSGTVPKDVKDLLKQFFASQKMMKSLGRRRGMGKIPGVPDALQAKRFAKDERS
ncbi:MAG: signal recognition particle protein Srp54 [Candidatus Atabeyarchaeum deiterrae]